VAAGCGGDPVPAPTTSLPANAGVSPRTYLNDSAFGAAALRRFVAVLDGAGPALTPARARAAAPDLAAAAADARLAWSRLAAARLEDTRLENQRRRIAPLLGDAVLAMEAVTAGAEAGDPERVVGEVAVLRRALTEITAAAG
jgi:uncharacterized protein YjeT (DUF2065 family)